MSMAPGASSSTAWRSRPVFISSTFRDMHAERDYLRAHVFPRLEEALRARRHFLEPIDLRVGVETAREGTEEARELLVLKVVLDEVKRSRPFMIVLLGDRYGWVPSADRLHAAAQEQDLRFDVGGMSVTAMEIEFGILAEDPSQRQRTFFFFRQPLPYSTMPADVAATYSDAHSPDSHVRAGRRRLKALKKRIRRDRYLGPLVTDYAVTWDVHANTVSGLEAFGELVYQRLWAALDQETAVFASLPAPTWQEQERAALDEFIVHRRRDFVGRGTLLEHLRTVALGTEGSDSALGACVTGRPGSGKSALFAELSHRLTQDGRVLVLADAAGATMHGSKVDAMLRRWIEELATHLGVANPIPDNATPDDVESVFYRALQQTSHTTRVAVLVDALDQFEATPRGTHLTWFKPAEWPTNAVFVATSLPCPAAEALGQCAGVEKIDIPALSSTDVAAVAKATWRRYHRDINVDVVRILAEKTAPDGELASGNPLWLTLALEQLNLLDADDFARADREYAGSPVERLRKLVLDTAGQMPGDVAGLYGWLLTQNEKVFGAVAARAFVVAIALSQRGWRELDLAGIMPRLADVLMPGADAPKVDDLSLATLRRGFRAHVVRRGEWGQLDFGHAQMRAAVKGRYLTDEAVRRQLHGRMSDYIETLDSDDPVALLECMWQLIGERNAARAAGRYATPDDSWPVAAGERVGSTWTLVEWIASDEAQRTARPDAPDDGALSWVLSWLEDTDLHTNGRHSVASSLMWRALDLLKNDLRVDGQLRLAEAIERAMVSVSAEDPGNAGWQRDQSVSHRIVGDLHEAQGDLAGALEAFRQGLAVAERLAAADPGYALCQYDLSILFERLGGVAEAQGRRDEAKAYFLRKQEVIEQLAAADPENAAWQHDLAASQGEVANVLVAQGNLAGALEALLRALAIAERLAAAEPGNAGWQRDLEVSHSKVGDVLQAQGNLAGALEAFRRALAIAGRLSAADPGNARWQLDLAVSHVKVGDVLVVQGNLSGALEDFRLGQASAERLAAADPGNAGWQHDLGVSYGKVGNVLVAQGNLAGALAVFRRSLAIQEQLAAADPGNAQWQRDVSRSHERVGFVLEAQENPAEALEVYRRGLSIAERLADADPGNARWQYDLGILCERLGGVAMAQGRLDEAKAYFVRRHGIIERLVAADPGNAAWRRDLAVSHSKVGDVLLEQGNLAGALEAFRRALAIVERLAEADPGNAGWQSDLARSHFSLAGLAHQQGTGPLEVAELRQCLSVLSAMKRRGMHLDPPLQRIYEQLAGIFGG
jgi:tetratricopeptide (TPR) repeat protein